MTFRDGPPVATLNAVLNSIKKGLSKGGGNKQAKIQKILTLTQSETLPDTDSLLRILSEEYQKQQHTIQQLTKHTKQLEDILQEYEPMDTHMVKGVIYHFDYGTQTLWENREKRKECGKYDRESMSHTMY